MPAPPHRLAGPPGGRRRGGQPPTADPGRIRRPAVDPGKPRGVHRGRPRARRGARPRAAARPPRPRQDHAGADRRARARRGLPRHLGTGDPAGRGPRRNPDKPPTQGCPVHRRNPPPPARHRGSALPGDGRLPARPDHRRGAGGALGAHRPVAVHAGRRHHAGRPAGHAAARPLRHPAAPGVLHARRNWN